LHSSLAYVGDRFVIFANMVKEKTITKDTINQDNPISAKNAPNRPPIAFASGHPMTLDIRPPIAEMIWPLLSKDRDFIFA